MRSVGTFVRKFGSVRDNVVRYENAFGLLKKYRSPKFDWTVANAISGPSNSVQQFCQENFSLAKEEWSDAVAGDNLKNVLVSYFNNKGVATDYEDIVIGGSILSLIGTFYNKLELANKKKSVLIPSPSFGLYHLQCNHMGIESLSFPTLKEHNWRIDPELLDYNLARNPDVEVLMLNYPNNPTGKMLSEDEMYEICEVLKNYPHVKIFSDEIFIDMSMSEKEQKSIGVFEDISDRLIILNGVSKSRGLAGFRISFAHIRNKDLRIPGDDFMRPSVLGAELSAIALEDSEDNRQYLLQNRIKYLDNIEKVQEQIDIINEKIAGVMGVEKSAFVKPYNIPESGNVILIDFSGLKGRQLQDGTFLMTGYDVAKFMYEKSGVATVPGECSFIDEEEMAVRISLSHSPDELEQGFTAIGDAMCENLQKSPIKVSGKINVDKLDNNNRHRDL